MSKAVSQTTQDMADALNDCGVDLGDERAAICALHRARWDGGGQPRWSTQDVVDHFDAAMERARVMQVRGYVLEGIGVLFCVAVWTAIYCVVCPVGGA